jgi:hypothetical protein
LLSNLECHHSMFCTLILQVVLAFACISSLSGVPLSDSEVFTVPLMTSWYHYYQNPFRSFFCNSDSPAPSSSGTPRGAKTLE